MKFEDKSETSSSHGGSGCDINASPIPQLPKLQGSVCNVVCLSYGVMIQTCYLLCTIKLL